MLNPKGLVGEKGGPGGWGGEFKRSTVPKFLDCCFNSITALELVENDKFKKTFLCIAVLIKKK